MAMSDDRWVLPSGEVLTGVHPDTACEGRGCVIHHPSDHHMRDWPLNWRNDRGLMERLCPHGVGHPDPDDLAWKQTVFHPDEAAAEGIHGCDRCCLAEETA
jgi:hypothetical protein